MFTRALHWSLSWARSIQSIPSHPISLRSILILSTHLQFDFSKEKLKLQQGIVAPNANIPKGNNSEKGMYASCTLISFLWVQRYLNVSFMQHH
jgi:hypothetical protein